jgi:hypothetical protein
MRGGVSHRARLVVSPTNDFVVMYNDRTYWDFVSEHSQFGLF